MGYYDSYAYHGEVSDDSNELDKQETDKKEIDYDVYGDIEKSNFYDYVQDLKFELEGSMIFYYFRWIDTETLMDKVIYFEYKPVSKINLTDDELELYSDLIGEICPDWLYPSAFEIQSLHEQLTDTKFNVRKTYRWIKTPGCPKKLTVNIKTN